MFGCIHVPDFPVQAALLPESKALPVALLDGPDSLLKVVACNAPARGIGVFIGMTKPQAEICGVTLIKRVQEHEDAAQTELIDAAYNFSPRIEATSPGTIIIDLSGSERLLGTGKTIAQLILGEVLNPAPDVLDVLHAWGIRDFKSLAALPSIELTERLGQQGLHLQRLARGAVMRELVPAALPASFQESRELEEPIELLEPLAFVLNSQLEQLMERLVERSLATDHIEIDLTLEVHSDRDVNATVCCSTLSTYQRTVKLPVPTQDTKVLLKLAQLDLAAHPPHAPVKKIKIAAIPARIRFTQTGLFQPLAPEPATSEITMARIRAGVGETDSQTRNLVGFPALLDSHWPDHFKVVPPGAKQGNSAEPSTRLALRRFRPAIPARVEVNAEQAPVWIGFSRKKAQVTCASGPWRGGGQWWDAAGEWLREEWDINLTLDGHTALYRIFRDLATRKWFVEGMYD